VNWCRFGLHRWVMCCLNRTITHPKLGPYDPRTDEQRTRQYEMDVCAQCGEERETKAYEYMCP